MRWLLLLLVWLPVSARAASDDAVHARRSFATARTELQAGRDYLRGLEALAQAPDAWDRVHPLTLFDGADRAVHDAATHVAELSSLADGPLHLAAPAVARAANHLADARSDLRALAAPVHGLATSPGERTTAVERLARSLDAAARDLDEVAPVLQGPHAP